MKGIKGNSMRNCRIIHFGYSQKLISQDVSRSGNHKNECRKELEDFFPFPKIKVADIDILSLIFLGNLNLFLWGK